MLTSCIKIDFLFLLLWGHKHVETDILNGDDRLIFGGDRGFAKRISLLVRAERKQSCTMTNEYYYSPIKAKKVQITISNRKEGKEINPTKNVNTKENRKSKFCLIVCSVKVG